MNIRIEVNPSQVKYQGLAALYGKSGWGQEEAYTDQWLETALKNTTLFALALDEDDRLLGLVRALTDHVSVTWIAEILVDPDHRHQGIGTRLMNEIIDRTRHTAVYTGAFVGTEGFFEKFRITKKPILVAISRKALA